MFISALGPITLPEFPAPIVSCPGSVRQMGLRDLTLLVQASNTGRTRSTGKPRSFQGFAHGPV